MSEPSTVPEELVEQVDTRQDMHREHLDELGWFEGPDELSEYSKEEIWEIAFNKGMLKMSRLVQNKLNKTTTGVYFETKEGLEEKLEEKYENGVFVSEMDEKEREVTVELGYSWFDIDEGELKTEENVASSTAYEYRDGFIVDFGNVTDLRIKLKMVK